VEVRFTKKFLKELSKIPVKVRAEVEVFVFKSLVRNRLLKT